MGWGPRDVMREISRLICEMRSALLRDFRLVASTRCVYEIALTGISHNSKLGWLMRQGGFRIYSCWRSFNAFIDVFSRPYRDILPGLPRVVAAPSFCGLVLELSKHARDGRCQRSIPNAGWARRR